MTICFVANFTKTYFFHAIALKLKLAKCDVVWICVNSNLYDFLCEHYDREKILYLGKDRSQETNKKIGEFKLNELIFGDRVLTHFPEFGITYLLQCQNPIYEFLKIHQVRFIIGEHTWAHELLIHRIADQCKELNVQFLNAHTIRIPQGRFTFFVDEFDSKKYAVQRIDEHINHAERTNTTVQLEKPDYLALNDKLLKDSRSFFARLHKIKRFFTQENIDKNDPTLISDRWLTLKLRVAEEFNREAYKLVRRVPISALDGKKFVLYALHKQPESSIDVTGRYYEDQLLNIRNIWRILPDDWSLVVKEHTNAIGDRSIKFYRSVTAMKNVALVHESIDSHELIRRCSAVFTVSGTIAYEAALLKIPAFTFSSMFFNGLNGCRKISLDDLRACESIEKLILLDMKSPALNNDPITDSFPGIISDPISNPACMLDTNISLIANAIAQLQK